jgi:hypothetical protein
MLPAGLNHLFDLHGVLRAGEIVGLRAHVPQSAAVDGFVEATARRTGELARRSLKHPRAIGAHELVLLRPRDLLWRELINS